MKSASLCDAVLPVATDPPSSRPFPQAYPASAPFGTILKEATGEQNAPTRATDSEDDADSDENKPAKSKKQEDPVSVSPLICFCPPPSIDPVEVATVSGNAATEALIPLTNGEPAPQQPTTATNGQEASPETPTLTEVVRPKNDAIKQTSNTPAGSGSIKLDPKLFRPVSDGQVTPLDTTDSKATETPEIQQPALVSAAHGTLVAQLENHVKNTEKSAEFAPVIEQKMPDREILRRAVVETSRVESFHAQKQTDSLLSADFDSGMSETIPVKSVEAARLVETIRTEVTSVRMRGDTTVSLVLRPDSATQLALDVSIGRDGTIHAEARCERGDFHTLQAQWPQLQQSLAAHGIRIADLSNQNQSQQFNHRSTEAFQNFERDQNSPQREQRDVPTFEEQFGLSRNKFSPVKPQPQPAAPASPTRRWQSWA